MKTRLHSRTFPVIGLGLAMIAVIPATAQVVVNLNSVIGPSGTNAASVSGVGLPVNFSSVASTGTTTLTAIGSTGSSSFNFNTGFSDTLDRATGFPIGGGNVFADLKWDTASTSPLLLDTNNNASFGDEAPQVGFGMHADTFITFDLDVIRANAGMSVGAALTLTGAAGVANWLDTSQKSAAIILDGSQLAVFDWMGTGVSYHQFDTYSLSIPGSARYLTFAGLSGLDNDYYGDHIGFANVQLTAVAIPEPSSVSLWLGLAVAVLAARRGMARRVHFTMARNTSGLNS